MKTIDFSQILFNALQFSGNDRQNIQPETFAQFRDFINYRLREIWESFPWVETTTLKEFTTNISTSSTNQSQTGEYYTGMGYVINYDAFPDKSFIRIWGTTKGFTYGDEVLITNTGVPELENTTWLILSNPDMLGPYNIAGSNGIGGVIEAKKGRTFEIPFPFQNQYSASGSGGTTLLNGIQTNYKTLSFGFVSYKNPNLENNNGNSGGTGNNTANTYTYFNLDSDASEVLGVFNKNPLQTTRFLNLDFKILDVNASTRIIVPSGTSTGWYFYRKQCPQLTGDVFDATISGGYSVGSQIYFDSGSQEGRFMPKAGKPHNGNFYVCILPANQGESPSTNPEKWRKIDIPYNFGTPLAWGATANWFMSEGMTNEAAVIEQKYELAREQEYDKATRQQGQTSRLNMTQTY